jgi:hypothetical protein
MAAPVDAAPGNGHSAEAVDGETDQDSQNEYHARQGLNKTAFKQLVQRVNAGDEQALQQLQQTLDTCPGIWQHVGDLAAHAEMSLIRLIAGQDRLLMESLQRSAAEMKKQLSRSGESELEKLAVQRVVACWLQLQHADAASAAPDQTLQQGKFWATEQDRAHRRYLSAVKQLTTLRQLLPSSAHTEPGSASSGNAATPTGKPVKSAMGPRNGSERREPEPDDRDDVPCPRPIVPFSEAISGREHPEAASG